MRVIFIDIDGPLAWGTWMDGGAEIETFGNSKETVKIPYTWVKEDCNALAEIVERTNAYLVVSSDWRMFYTLKDLRVIFQHHDIHGSVIDVTSQYNPMRKMSSPPEWDRACQIRSWIKAFKPEHWISIDDMPLNTSYKRLGIPQWRHVQVDGNYGMGGKLRDKVEECVKKLER